LVGRGGQDFKKLKTVYIMLDSVLLFLGAQEIILIVLALLLLFGGRKIPELMRGMGRGIREFKEGQRESPKEELKEEKQETVRN